MTPKTIFSNSSYPKNIPFYENPQTILKFKILNPPKWSEATYIWNYQCPTGIQSRRQRSWPTPWKITSGYRFPWKYWYGPALEAIRPLGSNCFSRKVRKAPCKKPWCLKNMSWPPPLPPAKFSWSARVIVMLGRVCLFAQTNHLIVESCFQIVLVLYISEGFAY